MYFALSDIRQRDPLQHVVYFGGNVRLSHAIAAQAIRDVVVNIHHRKKGQMLKDHFYVAFIWWRVDN